MQTKNDIFFVFSSKTNEKVILFWALHVVFLWFACSLFFH